MPLFELELPEKEPNSTQKKLSGSKNKQSLFTKRPAGKPFLLDVLFATLKCMVFALVLFVFAGLGLVYGVAKAYVDMTPVLDVSQLTKSDRTSYLYDRNGEEITTLASMEYRDWATKDEIPDMLKNAFISIEDVRFYKHQGVDFKRLLSAALEILGNKNSSGGSTITQQLIKNKILGSQRTYKRKVQEAYLALELEKIIDKDDILEAYLNDIYLGGSNYGVKAAAKDYFGKELSELTIRECALLAGLTQSPYYYNPRQNMYYREEDSYERTRNRTNTVLERMYENGAITLEQYQSAMAEEETILEVSQNSKMYEMAYFVEYSIYDVITHWMEQDGVEDTTANRTLYENKLRTGGYKIYTTVDPEVQNLVQSTLATWDGYPELADSSASVITEEISDTVTIQTIEPQAAAVVMDQHTGELIAIVGGRTEPQIRKGLNRAYQSYTEVGSSIKPLAVYGPALDTGLSPASVVVNAEGAIEGWDTEKGYPSGGLSSKYYGFVTLRTGLKQSLNVVAARLLLEHVGIDTAAEYMTRLGIPATQLNLDGSGLALGTSGITPIQMCGAYAAIANNGYYLKPLSFTRVEDEHGNIVLDADIIRGGSVKVYDQSSTAYQLVDLMKDAVNNGTGKEARISGYEVAGKTGTNSHYSSVYFAGMTCKYTSVVFIGHDQPANKLKYGSTGGDYAASLWNAYMSQLMEGVESTSIIQETTASLGLVERTVCPVSGKLATSACVHYQSHGSKFKLVTDWFDYDSVPTEYCDMHVTLSICNLTNCKATESCDPEHIEEVTQVLIRPTSSFYTLSDSVLEKIFEDTFVRTDKSTEQYIADYPLCTQSEGYAGLSTQVMSLLEQVNDFLDNTFDLTTSDRRSLQSAVNVLEEAEGYANISAAYTSLESLYTSISIRYAPNDDGIDVPVAPVDGGEEEAYPAGPAAP